MYFPKLKMARYATTSFTSPSLVKVYLVLEISWSLLLFFSLLYEALYAPVYLIPATSLVALFTGTFVILGAKVDDVRIRTAWEVSGLLASLMLLLKAIAWESLFLIIFQTLFISFSLGWGLPSILSETMSMTSFENRGKISGILIMFIYLLFMVEVTVGFFYSLILMKTFALSLYYSFF